MKARFPRIDRQCVLACSWLVPVGFPEEAVFDLHCWEKGATGHLDSGLTQKTAGAVGPRASELRSSSEGCGI